MVMLDDLLATTCAISNAIATISFPGMFRIYDFHSKKAPRLKGVSMGMSMFGPTQEDLDEDDTADPQIYTEFFSVRVGSDQIYLEDPTYCNDSGWTALHTCCMSFSTVNAGLALVEEFVRRGYTLEDRTTNGPGSFNKGWTALHMCCAYGVEPLAQRLLNERADPSTKNCYGYTPLLEASHRGFVNIVTMLVERMSAQDIDYIVKVTKEYFT